MTRSAREILADARALALELDRLRARPAWVSLAEAARDLEVPVRTLRWRCASGRVEARRAPDGWQVAASWLAAELVRRMVDEERGNRGNAGVRDVG